MTTTDPPPMPSLTLVLGGMRSGKSMYAESLIETRGPGLYLATADAGDAEMAERIRRHRARRGSAWSTVEAPLDIVGALGEVPRGGRPVLVDCLTLWLSNVMEAGRDVDAESRVLIEGLRAHPAPVVAVSNEVGLGIVPDNALGRAFADAAGRLNQSAAQAAERVVFMAAGLAVVLKPPLEAPEVAA
ncbi:MAG: bifunctional adenosylcobinamide kinase/adenosylcobinamide-phosphate guanylyltransferase [Rhodospirillales bacterium]|nr:bifunctional adenosylcobinamide kinase/adenosylcobinamide-phosphate guanylyltransferase [Rhodospirillales bacterium]MDP6805322.1 bifunctional adenosylcobinamide kinase/adenosylcobinamide-phosphate guanylyltransferase [Rhodospirillales bacterium]